MFCVRFDVAGTHLAIDIKQTASRSITARYVHIGTLDHKIYDEPFSIYLKQNCHINETKVQMTTGEIGSFSGNKSVRYDCSIARLMYTMTSMNIDFARINIFVL